MKKWMIVFALLIFIGSVNAISISHNAVYSQGETVILKIEGQILEPIGKDSFKFMRGHEGVPVENEIIKIGSDYYLWFITPKSMNNYSVTLEGVSTTVSGIPSVVDYSFNISTSNSIASYSVKPGAILSSKDFDIEIFLNGDVSKEINVEGDMVKLEPGPNTVLISIEKVDGTQLTMFNVGNYQIPAYIIGEKNIPQGLKFIPDVLVDALLVGEGRSYSLELENVGNESEKNVEIVFDENYFESDVTFFEEIEAGGRVQFDIKLKEGLSEHIDEVITANYGGSSASIVTVFSFVENEEEIEEVVKQAINETGQKSKADLPCSKQSGKVCKSDEKCIGTSTTALEGKCCLGNCVPEEEEGGSVFVGIILVLIVLGIVVFVYWRYMKVKGVNPLSRFLKK